MIFGTLAWTIELYMTKYIIGEIFSSGGATLYKNPSDQTVIKICNAGKNIYKNYFLTFYILVSCTIVRLVL